MRRVSTLVGLTLVTLAATARAQEAVPAAAAPAAAPAAAMVAPPAPPQRKLQVGLSLLPMGVGSFTNSVSGMTFTADAAFAFGFGLSAGYMLVPGLIVGVAPQAIFNVKPKDESNIGAHFDLKEYDLMARVAYAYPIVDTITVYAELLPGYSLIVPSSGATAKGFVLGFGAGAAIDLWDRMFTNLGVGYQVGFQKGFADGVESDASTRYLRVAFGVGMRF